MLEKQKIKYYISMLFSPIIKILRFIESIFAYMNLKKYKSHDKVLLLLTPEHGNLGDQAIALATKDWLREKYKDQLLLDFPFHEVKRYMYAIKWITKKSDIVILHGGGNMGDHYIDQEVLRRNIVKSFRNNCIISMPQSVFFSNTSFGKSQFKKSKKVYNEHKNLTLILREKISYNLAKENFYNSDVYLAPDIVLFWEDFEWKNKRDKDVLFCFRNDKEKVLDESNINKLTNIIKHMGKKITYFDTHINKNVFKSERYKEVNNIISTFSKHKLIITDRFHGVIFAVLTKTPCIAFKSLDHKITEGIYWFKHLDYIKYIGSDEFDKDEVKKLVIYALNKEAINNDYIIKRNLKNILDIL